jgi:hypothetical protein
MSNPADDTFERIEHRRLGDVLGDNVALKGCWKKKYRSTAASF